MKTLLMLLLLCTLTTTAGAMGMPHRSTVSVTMVSLRLTADETTVEVTQEPEVFSPNWWSHSLVSRFLNWVVGFFGQETFGSSLSCHTPQPAAVLPQA